MEQIIIHTPGADGKLIPLETKGEITKLTKAEQRVALLGEDVLSLTVESPYPQEYGIGAKIYVFGREYTLNQLPVMKKKGVHSYSYDLTFEGVQYELARVQYEVCIGADDAQVYGDALMGDLKRFLTVLIANMDEHFKGKWALGKCPETDTRNLTFNCENCLSVLQRLCSEFEQEFEIVQNNGVSTIHIRKAGSDFPFTFRYGKGKGLYELSRQNVSSANIITRLKVFGGTANLGPHYPNSRLCLPGCTKLKSVLEDKEALNQYGVWEATKHFDEIYPRMERSVSAPGNSVYEFVDDTMFDLNEVKEDGVTTTYLIGDVLPKICFNTGGLAGYQFDVNYNHATRTFKLKQQTDERGMSFPSETSPAFQIGAGDKYVLVDINMPEEVIGEAEELLKEKGEEYLKQNCQPKVQYGLTIQEDFLKNNFVGAGSTVNIFSVGDYIPVEDEDIHVNKSIRITGFTRDILNPYRYVLTLADAVERNIYNRIISDLNEIDRIIHMNDFADPTKARRNWLSTQELLGMVFDPEGDYYTEKIKPASIETQMLAVGAKSTQFVLQNTMIEANYGGNPENVSVTGGLLVHYAFPSEDGTTTIIRDWNLGSGSAVLSDRNAGYYIYGKCERKGKGGTIIFSKDEIVFDSDPGYYHFWIGVVHSVVDDVRAISLTYGSTTINGKFIRTGRIESTDSNNYLDLDGNEFRVGNHASALEWNKDGDGVLRLMGTMVQSKSGKESPLGVWRGVYSNTESYYPGDEVSYTEKGLTSSYRRIGTATTKGLKPVNTTYWNVIAEGGVSGDWVSYVFKQAAGQPSKPTGSLSIPSGWSDAPEVMISSIRHSGTGWTEQHDGTFRSPAIGHNEITKSRIDFVTAKDNAIINIYLKVSSENNYDCALVGLLDNPNLTRTTNFRLNISGEMEKYVQIAVPKAGSHYVEVAYAKNSSVSKGYDCCFYKVVELPWWMSKATISGVTGNAGSWSVPVRVTGEDGVAGEDGKFMDYKYRLATSKPATPTVLDPTGWYDEPPTVVSGSYLWMICAEKNASATKLLSVWSDPVRISGEKGDKGDKGDKGAAGADGADGPGVVFRGDYSETETYYGSATRTDVVRYPTGSNTYYKTLKDAGSFEGILPTSTAKPIKWGSFGGNFESIATGLLFTEKALIAGFNFYNDIIKSTYETAVPGGSSEPALVLDGKNASINLISKKYKWTTGDTLKQELILDAKDGTIIARADGKGAAISSDGVYSNDPGIKVITDYPEKELLNGEYANNIRGSIVGVGTINKTYDLPDKIANAAGVVGQMVNTNEDGINVYGGWFDLLKVNGLHLGVKRIENDTTLTRGDTWVSCYNKDKKITVTLPQKPYLGQMIFLRQMQDKKINIVGKATANSGYQIHTDGNIYDNRDNRSSRGDTTVLTFDGQYWCLNYWPR